MTATEELVKELCALEQLARGLADASRNAATALSEDPPNAAAIGASFQSIVKYTAPTQLSLQLKVVVQAFGKWVRLNPGLSQEKLS